MKRPQTLRSQSGQVTVEAVLIFSIIAAITVATSRAIKQQAWAAELTRSPWAMVSGMIESGVWRDRQDAVAEHPNNNMERRISLKGENNDFPN